MVPVNFDFFHSKKSQSTNSRARPTHLSLVIHLLSGMPNTMFCPVPSLDMVSRADADTDLERRFSDRDDFLLRRCSEHSVEKIRQL